MGAFESEIVLKVAENKTNTTGTVLTSQSFSDKWSLPSTPKVDQRDLISSRAIPPHGFDRHWFAAVVQ
jgi:hypothetical protein